MTIQDQYANTVRQAQHNWSGVVQSAADNVQKAFAQPTPFTIIDPSGAIDQVFDFWEKTLEVQRDFAKQLAGASVAVGERVRAQAETVREGVREQAESTKRVVREQAESIREAAHEQAAQKYEQMTKAELADELSSRDLNKTGNVEELRERLIADDES